MEGWAMYKVGDHIEYDFEEYEIVGISLDERYWYHYNIRLVPEIQYWIFEEDIEWSI